MESSRNAPDARGTPGVPHLRTRRSGSVEYLELNRPDVRNALSDQTIAELTTWAEAIASDKSVRVAVISGAGKVFCAGADLNWFRAMASYTPEENVRDARAGARLFDLLDSLPLALIGRVHGAALGGGSGLASVCDIVVAADDAVFGFTEVKLGIIPAMIAPYALAKIGRSAARELFLTGRRFDAQRAMAIGLVHAVVPAGDLDARIDQYISELLSSGPEAIADAKRLLREIWHRPPRDVQELMAESIASRRASAEAQEGMRAFLDKRAPSWTQEG
jgi:methylglutaconyl-CoA hydratase